MKRTLNPIHEIILGTTELTLGRNHKRAVSMSNFVDTILKFGNSFNPAVFQENIEFNYDFTSEIEIESIADYYCHHFPHWMLIKLEDGVINFAHPTLSDFYIDPHLCENAKGSDLYSLGRNVVNRERFAVSFEDSYFLDCFIENHTPTKPVIIIHIDHHTDRGWFYGEILHENSMIKLSSTDEITPIKLNDECITNLRKRGILHQGNFLSLFSFFQNNIQVVYATDQLREKSQIHSILTSTGKDEQFRSITQFNLGPWDPNIRYSWREGPRSSLREMIEEATMGSPDSEIFVHIDLDEYDNPWDGNSFNEGNLEKNTHLVIKDFILDLSIIDSFKPRFTHFCMPTGFFPSKHWLQTLKAIEGFYD